MSKIMVNICFGTTSRARDSLEMSVFEKLQWFAFFVVVCPDIDYKKRMQTNAISLATCYK